MDIDTDATTVNTNLVTTFDAKNQLSPAVINLIKKNGEKQLKAPELSREFWTELRKTDLTLKGIINYITFESLYERFKTQIFDIFGFITIKDLFELLDDDNDGFLNEDDDCR